MWHSRPRLWVCSSDHTDHTDPVPSRTFPLFVANKGTSRNRPLGGPCETLAWPLGDAWVNQGRPNPNPKPNPSRQRVATYPQVPNTKNQIPAPLANCQLLFASCSFVNELRIPHPWALLDYSCFIRPNQLRIRPCPSLRSAAPKGVRNSSICRR